MAAALEHLTTVLVHHDGPVARLTLNRPEKLNPLGTTTLAELVEAASWLSARPELKVVVLGGAGRAFSAGADVSVFAGGEPAVPPREAADLGRRAADALEALDAVTIARLHGHCVGGGVVLAAACDLRVAAHDTRFSIPEVDLGIPLAWGGIPRLVREVGAAATRELVLTCRPFDAEEAAALGFLTRVVPPHRLDAEVEELVGQLLTKSALTLRATKRHINAVLDGMVGQPRSWSDADALVSALHDPESRQAAAAYLERLTRR